MGKFLEALRQTATRPAPLETPDHRNVAPVPVAKLVEEDEEVPFIEVGPHKSMEASASVLATRPLPASRAAAVSAMLGPVNTADTAVAHETRRRPHFAPEIIAHHQPDHPISGQYRDLLAVLTPTVSGEGAKALLFAPGLAGADAGAVLLNLAVTAVRQAKTRVVIVDANSCQQSLADRLGLAARPGLGEVLSGAIALDQALQLTDLAHLTVLAAGGPAPAGLRLVVETPASLLRKLRQRCDLVLVLGPSWDASCEALAAACDVVYLVLPEREAGSPRVDKLLQTFPRQNARFGGCILAAG
jgi:Mrp family chromosome partitioning ATPase